MATPNGGSSGGNGHKLPGWRFVFFAALLSVVVLGGNQLGIPREVAVPVLIGCLIALANGAIPTWFGKEK